MSVGCKNPCDDIERLKEAIRVIDENVADCCADSVGVVFCDSYGCGTLLELRRILTGDSHD